MLALIRTVPFALIVGLAAPLSQARPYRHLLEQPAAKAEPSASERCVRDFVAALNSESAEAVAKFEKQWASKARLERAPIAERIPRFQEMREQWGSVKLTSATGNKDGSATAAATTASGFTLEMNFNMSSAEPGKLDSIEIESTSESTPAHELTNEFRAETVEGVAKALREGYVFPDKGAKMADTILAKLKAGEYDTITSEMVFAKQLTDDCRAITHDGHLGIQLSPENPSAGAPMRPSHGEMRADNYAFKKVEVLPGNIGYIRFDLFIEDDEAKRVASNAIAFVSNCDAIIFDLRSNGGGSPEMIRYITSYLFDSRTHLNDMVDRDGKVVEEYWTVDDVPKPRPASGVPVYVLTSSRTFSGAEEFSYNLKNLKRATIIGETTGGGAHPVRGERVNDRFMVRVPFMRAQNPISKTNWEGTGVEPDVKVSASEALDKAVELAKKAAIPQK